MTPGSDIARSSANRVSSRPLGWAGPTNLCRGIAGVNVVACRLGRPPISPTRLARHPRVSTMPVVMIFRVEAPKRQCGLAGIPAPRLASKGAIHVRCFPLDSPHINPPGQVARSVGANPWDFPDIAVVEPAEVTLLKAFLLGASFIGPRRGLLPLTT